MYCNPSTSKQYVPFHLSKGTCAHRLDRAEALISNLDSYAEQMLQNNDLNHVQDLLDENEVLLDVTTTKIKESRQAIIQMMKGIDCLKHVQSCLNTKKSTAWSDLYTKAVSGELNDSVTTRETLLAVKKLPSDSLVEMLGPLSDEIPIISNVHSDLKRLISARSDQSAPLRSEHDIQHNTLRTTVVAQKVELSKQTAALSKQDMAYSKIVNQAATALQEYFQEVFINPQDLFLHEVLIYDAKSPYRDVFMPRPRFAVERALSSPHDYLGCTCCDGSENGLSPTQPATAILYQLYLESGSRINAADMWSAFKTIVGDDDAEDEEADQQRTLYATQHAPNIWIARNANGSQGSLFPSLS